MRYYWKNWTVNTIIKKQFWRLKVINDGKELRLNRTMLDRSGINLKNYTNVIRYYITSLLTTSILISNWKNNVNKYLEIKILKLKQSTNRIITRWRFFCNTKIWQNVKF